MTDLRFAPVMLAAALISSTGCAAADHDFNQVVSGVESHYSIRATRVPMMGFVSFCARVATHGGVKGMRIAEFDRLGREFDSEDLLGVVRKELGPEWTPIISEHSNRDGQQSMIFVRPAGRSMRMLIADYEHGELDVVRMELDGDELARFMRNPGGHHARHGEYLAENAQ